MSHVKDCYYFPHDSNARHDPKILGMRSVYGAEGYGWFWILIEMMREQKGYKLKISGKYAYNALAQEMSTTPDKAKEYINDCINEFGLFKSDGDYFWSESLLRRMERKNEIRKVRAEAGRAGGRKRAEREREAKDKGTHTKEEWEEMIKFFEFKCVRCGCEVDGKPVKDHIKPLYQGGSDDITNIQPLCRTCNASKGPEDKDFRPAAAQANGKQMPSKWLATSKQSSSSKVKKRKENIIKDFNNTVKPKIELAYNTPELEKEFTNLPQNEQLSIVVEAFNKTFPDQFKKFKTGGAVTARREFEKAANTGVNLHDLLLTIIYGDWGTDVPPWDIVAVAREPTNMALVNASIDRQEQRGGIECVGCAP